MGNDCLSRDGAALVLLAAWVLLAAPAAGDTTVSVNSGSQYQTILGWGATTPWLMDVPDPLAAQIIDLGANDLGLTRLRYEGPSGSRANDRRWEWTNDNGDPLQTDWSAFNTASLDAKVAKWVVPFKQAVQARGDPFDIYVSPSFFDGGSSGSPPAWLLNSPGEYAEYATSILLRLRDQHGIEANWYSICNEAGNNNPFTAPIVGNMIKTLAPRMQQLGLSTKIQFPECVSADTSWSYIQALAGDAKVWEHVGVVSYHLYGGNSRRTDIRDFALARGLPTAQTEYMGLTIDHLYDDLILGGVSYWELYGDGFPAPDANRTSFSRYSRYWDMRQVMHYVRPGAVRLAAGSGDPNLRALAFAEDGQTAVVLINNKAGSVAQTVTVTGLAEGDYGVCRSIGGGVYQELGVRTVGPAGTLDVYVPTNAVYTVYPYAGTNQPPTVTDWRSSAAYLTLGQSSSTTLSASATDPELDATSYAWTVVSQPAGGSAVLATPGAASTSATGLTRAGEYVFNVAVSDAGHAVNREVRLNVYDGNQAPHLDDVHNRLPVEVTLPTTSTALRAWAWDVENNPLAYQWSVLSQPVSANAQLSAPTGSSCQANSLTVPGDYVFRVEARDATNAVHQDLTVTVYPANSNAPFIQNLAGQVLPAGGGVLSATTGDADGDVISHWWSVQNAPAGAEVVFADQGAPATSVSVDRAGTYQFILTVVDRTRYTTSGAVQLSLTPPPPDVAYEVRYLGDGLYGLVFTVRGNDGEQASFLVDATFEGPIRQTKAFGVLDVNNQTDASALNGLGEPPYDKDRDSWFGDAFTRAPATIFELAQSDTAYHIEAYTGGGSAYLDALLAYVCAGGDVAYYGTITRLGSEYDFAGVVVLPAPGDANRDGSVDGADYTLWADRYLQTGAGWGGGDFNGDGTVDGADYTIWADFYGTGSSSGAAVPEPVTAWLVLAGSLLAARRRAA